MIERWSTNVLNPVVITQTWDIAPVSIKEFLDIQATAECMLTLKGVCDMTRTHSHLKFITKIDNSFSKDPSTTLLHPNSKNEK